MSGALSSFCLMAIGARELSGEMDVIQILFYRSIIGLIVISFIIIFLSKKNLFYSHRIKIHVLRNIFHFGGQYGWFLGIGLLPLAEVFALEFTVPFWTALIAWLFLKEQLNSRKLLAIAIGLIGVVIIVKPGPEIFNPASFIVLAAAILYAVSHTATKSLSSTESPITIVFFMCLVQLPIGFLFSISKWQNPTIEQWTWIVTIGLTALSAHYCMSKAMQFAEVTTIVIIDFFRLPLIAMAGVLFYHENFEITLIVGGILMLTGNVVGMKTSNSHQRIEKTT